MPTTRDDELWGGTSDIKICDMASNIVIMCVCCATEFSFFLPSFRPVKYKFKYLDCVMFVYDT